MPDRDARIIIKLKGLSGNPQCPDCVDLGHSIDSESLIIHDTNASDIEKEALQDLLTFFKSGHCIHGVPNLSPSTFNNPSSSDVQEDRASLDEGESYQTND